MENVVTTIFEVESEAFQALSELRLAPVGEGYVVAEAALLKREGDNIVLLDGFDTGAYTANDTADGMLIGSIVGILGGPLGVLLGAGTGALAGSIVDTDDAMEELSMVTATANKLYDGEVAVIALVQEDEPAFDAAFDKFETTIIRHDAVAVMDEVDRACDYADELERQAAEQMRAERKAARKDRRDERANAMRAHFDEVSAKGAEAVADVKAKNKAFVNDVLDSSVDAIDSAAEHLPDGAKEFFGMKPQE